MSELLKNATGVELALVHVLAAQVRLLGAAHKADQLLSTWFNTASDAERLEVSNIGRADAMFGQDVPQERVELLKELERQWRVENKDKFEEIEQGTAARAAVTAGVAYVKRLIETAEKFGKQGGVRLMNDELKDMQEQRADIYDARAVLVQYGSCFDVDLSEFKDRTYTELELLEQIDRDVYRDPINLYRGHY